MDFITAGKDAIKDFNSYSDIEGYRISDLEEQVVMMLPHQTDTFFKALEYHWQIYKAGESGLPLSYFNKEIGLFENVESDKKGVWAQVYDMNSFKKEVVLLYLIRGFLKCVKQVLRKRLVNRTSLTHCTKDP